MSQLTDNQWYWFTNYARTTLNRIKNNNANRVQLRDELVRVLRGSGRGGRIGGIPTNLITQADAVDAANKVLDELIRPIVVSASQLLRQLINQGWDDREAIADQLENHILFQVQNPALAVEIADNILERQYSPAANLLDFTYNGFQDSGTMSALTSVGLLLTLGLTWTLFAKK
jgi:hypothetical protein